MMSRLRLTLYLPLSVVIRRGLGAIIDRWRGQRERAASVEVQTYTAHAPADPLTPLLNGLDVATFRSRAAFAVPLADLYRKGMFDLLGSGWVAVRHGMVCAGVEAHVYPPAPAVSPDRDGNWLRGRINPTNLAAAQAVWRLVSTEYTPIDWHLDFKSGFRWREDTWYRDIAYGHAPGADVKIPWELARMQHLALLAAAYAATGDESYPRAMRDQVLDFITKTRPVSVSTGVRPWMYPSAAPIGPWPGAYSERWAILSIPRSSRF